MAGGASIGRVRFSYLALGLGMIASAAFHLWLTRGFTFYNDEIGWFASAPTDYEPGVLLRPHNTHLIAIPRIIYATSLHLFGPSYLPFRVIAVAGVLLCAGLFFVLARRRIGEPPAVAGALVLLFFGTAWEVTVSPIGIPFLYATAFGLASFVALERGDRRGDVAASACLALSLASHSIGLMFLVGVAVALLLDEGRVKRLWVYGVPLVLFIVWWLLAPESPTKGSSLAELSNIPLLPVFAFLSLGAVLDALLGLNFRPGTGAIVGFNRTPLFTWVLAPVLALAAIGALMLRLRRGRVPRGLWVFGAAAIALWIFTGISASPGRQPTTERYLYPGAAMVLLVAAEAARRVRFGRRTLVVVFALAALSVGVNVVHALHARQFLAAFSANARPTFAMIELGGPNVDGSFRPRLQAQGASPNHIGVNAEGYRLGVAKWGSPAASLDEVRRAPAVIRGRADVVLTRALALRAAPIKPPISANRCRTMTRSASVAQTTSLPAGGAIVQSLGSAAGPIRLRRFGEAFRASIGALGAGDSVMLVIPRDTARQAWHAALPSGRLRVCAISRQALTGAYCRLSRDLDEAAAQMRDARRRGARPEQVAAARRDFVRRSRALAAPLAQVTPPEIKGDVQILGRSLLGRARPEQLRPAQARVEAFQRKQCG